MQGQFFLWNGRGEGETKKRKRGRHLENARQNRYLDETRASEKNGVFFFSRDMVEGNLSVCCESGVDPGIVSCPGNIHYHILTREGKHATERKKKDAKEKHKQTTALPPEITANKKTKRKHRRDR